MRRFTILKLNYSSALKMLIISNSAPIRFQMQVFRAKNHILEAAVRVV